MKNHATLMKQHRIVLSIALLLVALFAAGTALADSTWICPNCGKTNNSNYCTNDGTARPSGWTCPSCGTVNDSDAYYCKYCGKKNSSTGSSSYYRDPYEEDEYYRLAKQETKGSWERLYYFKLSADAGYAMGQYQYANYLENGWGCEKSSDNYDEVFDYYKRAALQGHSTAQAALGRCYLWGRGTAADADEAVYWFELSCDQGDDLGQLWLGYCYDKGCGVAKNKSKARYYYQLSADQGNENAEKRLEDMG